jgi:hypothetical protein
MPPWLLPWIIVGVGIWPLYYLESWIHKHIQGLGLLITNDPEMAVLLYYVSLLPGVVLHELSQWLLALLLKVKVKRFRLWPEQQTGDVLRLGLVEIEEGIDVIRSSLIGLIPLLTGSLVISLIGSSVIQTGAFLQSLNSGDLRTIWEGFRGMASTPDFFVWVYLVFAIANAMLPEEHDEINWLVLAGALVGIAAVLFVLDLGILVQASLEGFMLQLARWLSMAIVMALIIDVIVAVFIVLAEELFGRLLNREVEYR